MDFTQYTLAAFVIIGLVNGIRFAVLKQWQSFAFFMTAVVAGLIFGFLKWFGLSGPEIGLAVGINSSGVYKVATKIGGQ